MELLLPMAVEKGVRIITNMGASVYLVVYLSFHIKIICSVILSSFVSVLFSFFDSRS